MAALTANPAARTSTTSPANVGFLMDLPKNLPDIGAQRFDEGHAHPVHTRHYEPLGQRHTRELYLYDLLMRLRLTLFYIGLPS